MSNEEQVADTIEMLYERLNSYNKQDLFNYGYLLESNEILCKDIEEKDKEIERLKEELKYTIPIVEHNKTIQSNINSYNKLSKYVVELEDRIDEINNLNEKISLALESAEHRLDKAIEYIEHNIVDYITNYDDLREDLLDILKGVDKE